MDDFRKAYNKALRFLSYRQRSEKEVRENLLKKNKRHSGLSRIPSVRLGAGDSGVVPFSGTPQNDIVDQVIDKLKEQKFLNDEEFARSWIESRSRAKPRALRVIKMELKQKGIQEDIIEKILGDEDTKILSDIDMAKKLIEKKVDRYKNVSSEEKRNKLGQFLARKGFGWDTIKEVLDPLSSRT